MSDGSLNFLEALHLLLNVVAYISGLIYLPLPVIAYIVNPGYSELGSALAFGLAVMVVLVGILYSTNDNGIEYN